MPPSELCAAQVLLAGAADQVAAAVSAFEALGFRTGPVVGGSFSIEAPTDKFEVAFGVQLQHRADGGMRILNTAGSPLQTLPLQRLPALLQPLLQYVVFSEPPAFGPGAKM